MKKGATPPPEREDRSTTQCGSNSKGKQNTEKATESSLPGAGAEPMEQTQASDLELPPTKQLRAPRASACHPFVRKQIAEALPELCKAFLGKAKDGDLSTMKLLWQMAELDKQTKATEHGADRKFVRQSLAKYRKR